MSTPRRTPLKGTGTPQRPLRHEGLSTPGGRLPGGTSTPRQSYIDAQSSTTGLGMAASPEPLLNEIGALRLKMDRLAEGRDRAQAEVDRLRAQSEAYVPSRLLAEMGASFQLCFRPRGAAVGMRAGPRPFDHGPSVAESEHQMNAMRGEMARVEAENTYLRDALRQASQHAADSAAMRARCPSCLQVVHSEVVAEDGGALELRRLRTEVETLKSQLQAASEIQRSRSLSANSVEMCSRASK